MSGANRSLLLRPPTLSSLRCIIVCPAWRHLGKQSIYVIGAVHHPGGRDQTSKAREATNISDATSEILATFIWIV